MNVATIPIPDEYREDVERAGRLYADRYFLQPVALKQCAHVELHETRNESNNHLS